MEQQKNEHQRLNEEKWNSWAKNWSALDRIDEQRRQTHAGPFERPIFKQEGFNRYF